MMQELLSVTTMYDTKLNNTENPLFDHSSSSVLSHSHSQTSLKAQQQQQQQQEKLQCPRCNSTNTKFCYYNNYNLSQPRHFCKTCRRYWTKGGSLRNVPIGGGCRKAKTISCIAAANHSDKYSITAKASKTSSVAASQLANNVEMQPSFDYNYLMSLLRYNCSVQDGLNLKSYASMWNNNNININNNSSHNALFGDHHQMTNSAVFSPSPLSSDQQLNAMVSNVGLMASSSDVGYWNSSMALHDQAITNTTSGASLL